MKKTSQPLPRVARQSEPPREGVKEHSDDLEQSGKRRSQRGGLPPFTRQRRALKKLRAERSGRHAETLAAIFLQLKGYRILARRYKTPVGEIDLIAKRGRTIAFIEVKGRNQHASAAEAVHATNQARVVRAAQWWLQRHGQYIEHEVRFDACLIAWYRGVHHITHAFTAAA